MKRLIKLLLCFLLVVGMVLPYHTRCKAAEIEDFSDEVTEGMYETSLTNLDSAGILDKTSPTVQSVDIPSAKLSSDYGLKTYSGAKITEDCTLWSNDGNWCMTGYSDTNSFVIKSYNYQGRAMSATARVPDYFDMYIILNAEDIYDNDNKFIRCDVIVGHVICTVTSISTAFNGSCVVKSTCDSLDVIVPKRVTNIDANAFESNTKLTSVKFLGDIQKVGSCAFAGCVRLKTLDLSGMFEHVASNTIPDKCFFQCNSLENISIPESILNIGNEAFYQCNTIDYLTLSKNIKTIGDKAFAMCTHMRYLYIDSNYSDWKSVVDASEKSKLVTKPATADDIIVCKSGDSKALGKQIFSHGVFNILSTIDLDPASIKITKDKSPVTFESTLIDVYGHSTRGIRFSISSEGKGAYLIQAKDILGNQQQIEFSYLADIEDKTPPEIFITGEGSNGYYKSAEITYKDNETSIGSVVFDDMVVNTDAIECTTEGSHKVVVKDVFGNTSELSYYIDTTQPEIQGIEDGKMYSSPQVAKVSDGGSGIQSILLNGVLIPSLDVSISTAGKNTLVVKDKAGNMSEVNVTVDSIGPRLVGISGGKVYKEDIVINPSSICGIKCMSVVYKLDDITEEYPIMAGSILNRDGFYTIKLEDILGVSYRYELTLDKTAPVISGVTDGQHLGEKAEVQITDISQVSSTLNGEETNNTVITIRDDGDYALACKDKAGNTSSVTFVRDAKAPEITGVENDALYKKAVTLKALDNISLSTVTLNGKAIKSKYKVSKSGKYTVKATDMSGNSTTVKFRIDVYKPKFSVKNKSKIKKGRKIKITEKYSGIKDVSIDGQSVGVKKNVKFSTRGKHKVTVTDNAGNVSKLTIYVK